MDDIISIITSFIPEDFKTFRLVSKRFSKIAISSIDLDNKDALWLCKVYISNKRSLEEIKKHLTLVKDDLLIWASRLGYLETVKYVVSIGVDIRAQDNLPVIVASRYGHLEVVKYLVSLGADIKAQDNQAVTDASGNGHLDLVKYLVSIEANITDQNDWAFIYASCNGHLEVVKYLVSIGVNFKTRGNSAIALASGSGHTDVVKYLESLGVSLGVSNPFKNDYFFCLFCYTPSINRRWMILSVLS